MATALSSQRGIFSTAITAVCVIAFACAFQAAFAPTVRVSCPARTSSAPDCDLRWLVAFDMIQVRHTPLPGLQPGNEIESTTPGKSRQGGAITMFLKTSAGPVRAIMWGDHLSLQRDLRDPLHAYFANPNAPATRLTMKASYWTDPGGEADNRMVRKTHPLVWACNTIVAVGVLMLLWVPVTLARSIGGGNRP